MARRFTSKVTAVINRSLPLETPSRIGTAGKAEIGPEISALEAENLGERFRHVLSGIRLDLGEPTYGFLVEVLSERIQKSGSNSTFSGRCGSLRLIDVCLPWTATVPYASFPPA